MYWYVLYACSDFNKKAQPGSILSYSIFGSILGGRQDLAHRNTHLLELSYIGWKKSGYHGSKKLGFSVSAAMCLVLSRSHLDFFSKIRNKHLSIIFILGLLLDRSSGLNILFSVLFNYTVKTYHFLLLLSVVCKVSLTLRFEVIILHLKLFCYA